MSNTKVFVGNLSFKTKSQDLAGEFSAVGKVLDSNIITRGNRSLGYGFVNMDTEENAAKAVTMMNKKNIDGRDINVEVARPRDEAKIAERRQQQKEQRQQRNNFRRRRSSRSRSANKEVGTKSSDDASATTPNASPAAPRRRPRRRNSRKPRTSLKEGDENAAVVAAKPRREKKEASSVAADENNNKEKNENSSGRRRRNSRRRRSAGPPRRSQAAGGGQGRRTTAQKLEGGVPSTTSLFVANLPYSLDNQTLQEAFSAYNAKAGKVIFNKFGRSKGFGFVEFDSEKDQLAALENMHEKEVSGRKLAVKVTIVVPQKPKEENDATTTSDSAPQEKKEHKTE